jgi:hypothetical protein
MPVWASRCIEPGVRQIRNTLLAASTHSRTSVRRDVAPLAPFHPLPTEGSTLEVTKLVVHIASDRRLIAHDLSALGVRDHCLV